MDRERRGKKRLDSWLQKVLSNLTYEERRKLRDFGLFKEYLARKDKVSLRVARCLSRVRNLNIVGGVFGILGYGLGLSLVDCIVGFIIYSLVLAVCGWSIIRKEQKKLDDVKQLIVECAKEVKDFS